MQSISEIKIAQDLYNSLGKRELNKQTILVIEDSPQDIEVIKTALGFDHQYIYVPRGKDAVEIAQLKMPDLIMLDVKTAELDGYKICSRLKANMSTRNTPILLISSQARHCDKRGFIAGADDYINILIQPFVIKARVDHYLELKRCRDLLENPHPIDRLMNVTDRSQLIYHATREWRRAIRHQTPLSLIILEIDSFKAYTDYYGHLAGDDCLAQIECFLLKNMRREPDLVARYKGDEYACLLPETDACGAIKVANSIQEAMEELNIPFSCSQEADHVTMSFGVVTIRPASRLRTGFLLHQAELILSEAKRAGYNQIRCWQDC